MGLAEWRLVAETPEPVLNLCLAHAVTRQLLMALVVVTVCMLRNESMADRFDLADHVANTKYSRG